MTVSLYPQSHSHDKFVAALVVGVVVSLLVGLVLGYGLGGLSRQVGTSPLPQASFTSVHGTVTLPSGQYPYSIIFNETSSHETVGSSVRNSGDNYQVSLKTGHAYAVTIEYQRAQSGFVSYYKGCTPSPITATGSDLAINLLC